MKRLLVSLFLVVFTCIVLNAQKTEHIQGEIIVKLNKEHLENAKLFFETEQLKIKKILSISLGIYLLEFDSIKCNEIALLSKLKESRFVEEAQFNHKVTMRATVPNDTDYGNQWQYDNDGSFGGVIGADLDVDLAWDSTKGGTTIFGDTIVICILDDGIDTNHLDFENNIWVNHHEIPNNGIDDDGNGYIDDYKGWNIKTLDDSIHGGGHGTPIAGTIGAKGNNNLGVSGINWNVKLMIVKNDINTDEAAVIEAYSYPLAMRKLYNQTNGLKGAFVVATNSSWGIDYGNPDDAPLWCAMYDSLGKYGILNVGACANLNINGDVKGDLPTGCTSDFLISVTSLNNADVKVLSAGYGVTSIDLGAYGENVYTTTFGNGYGGASGTSNATPMVTGTIGLLYALNCSNLIQKSKENPAEAAILMKNAILSSVVLNSSLNGITKTNGKLNINNSVKYVLNNCDSEPCLAPFGLFTSEITDTSVLLNWNALMDTNYSFRYKNELDTVWTTLNTLDKFYSITDLKPCQKYEFQVKSACILGWSEFSTSFKFRTSGCGNCLATDYCSSKASSSTLVWIDSVGFDTLNQLSGTNGGYADFLTLDANFYKNQKYLLTVQPGFASTKYKCFYKIWIDFNQNSLFDSTEQVFENLIGDSLAISDSIFIPDSATLGATRMRVSMQIFSSTFNSCSSLSFGEVEDYCIGIIKKDTTIIDDTGSVFEVNSMVKLYPNPFQNQFIVELEDKMPSNITITDITGKIIFEKQYRQKKIVVEVQEEIINGIYFVKIELPNAVIVRKIMKN